MPRSHATGKAPSLPFSLGFTFILFLGLFSLALSQESRNPDAPTTPSPAAQEELAFGFDLGQSYGTSVARTQNGTVIDLAKVRGSPQYASLMERLVRECPTPIRRGRWPTSGQLWRFLKRSVGLAPTAEAAVLAEMIGALRAASDAALDRGGWRIVVDAVAISAPYVPAWVDSLPDDSIVNDALVLAGLQPWNHESSDPIYLVETSAVLADSGLRTCKLRWCAGHGPAVGSDEDGGLQSRIAFFISLTNESLYTSFQPDGCFYFPVLENVLGSIDPQYGLDKIDAAATPADFWDAIRSRLLHRASEYAEYKRGHPGYLDAYPIEILVGGEAADTPNFLDVVREVAKEIPGVLARPAGGDRSSSSGEGSVEVVVPSNPAFAAARGAAFWLGTWRDGSYCDEFYRSGELTSQYTQRDSHIEL